MSIINKILVTGGSGLIGKSLKNKENNFDYISSKDVDLTNTIQTNQVLGIYKPNIIIHLAGKVGGIKDNSENPYDFIQINNMINTNVIDYCVKRKIKIIFASSTCVYPKNSISYPMTEDMVDSGEPESTNDAYAYAKRFAGQMLRSANKQYGLEYCTLYFCNLYGENDDFTNTKKSHLVTSLIQKFHEAKINNINKVVLWGTGTPMRQFMHSDDAANLIQMVSSGDILGEYNAAISDNISVYQIAKIVKDVVGYTGSIEFNKTLDGVYRKDVCSDKLMTKIGCYDLDTCGVYNFIKLQDGVFRTYKKYMENNNVEINAR